MNQSNLSQQTGALAKAVSVLTAVIAIAIIAPRSAEAALTLQIDPLTETFYFTGSDAVTGSFLGFVEWDVSNTGILADSEITNLNQVAALSAGAFDGIGMNIMADAGVGLVISFSTTNGGGAFTITGTGVAASYAGLGANTSAFESLVGTTISGESGRGSGQDTMLVPEPSRALLGLMGIAAIGLRRRRS